MARSSTRSNGTTSLVHRHGILPHLQLPLLVSPLPPTILKGIYPTISTTVFNSYSTTLRPATILVVIIAYLADKSRMRGPFILALLPLSMIGYIMLLVTHSPKVKYGATFLIALGIYLLHPAS